MTDRTQRFQSPFVFTEIDEDDALTDEIVALIEDIRRTFGRVCGEWPQPNRRKNCVGILTTDPTHVLRLVDAYLAACDPSYDFANDPRKNFRFDVNFCWNVSDDPTRRGIMYQFRFRTRVAHEVLAAWRTLGVTTDTGPSRTRVRALSI